MNKETIGFLRDICKIKEYQNKPSVTNQGQCLDGYSALVNYNDIADKIKKYLERKK